MLTEGCKRLDAENFVEAQVPRCALDAALVSQQLSLPQQPPKD